MSITQVYVGGVINIAEFWQGLTLAYFSLEDSSPNMGLYICRTKLGHLFVAVMGGPHLSALLMSRGDSKIRGTYLRFTELTRHVVNFLASKNVSTGLLFSALTTYVDSSLSERHRRHVIGTQKVFKALDLPRTVGTLWWPTKIRALRHLRLDSDGFVESLLRIIRLRGTEVAMAIFAIAPFRLADQVYLVWLDLWFERLGEDKFVTFICNSVACRFHDAAFTVWLDLWFDRLGKDMFVTFICGSVACRFNDDAFTVWLDLWFERLGKDMFVTFICDSVACRFHDAAFTVWLDLWFDRLGKQKFVTFVGSSVSCRFNVASFASFLDDLAVLHNVKQKLPLQRMHRKKSGSWLTSLITQTKSELLDSKLFQERILTILRTPELDKYSISAILLTANVWLALDAEGFASMLETHSAPLLENYSNNPPFCRKRKRTTP